MSTFVHSRFVLSVCSLGLVVLLAACGSTGGGSSSAASRPAKTGAVMRVRYLAYKSAKKMELVNDSHSDRTEMYSTTKKLEDAFVKVTPDEVLDETIANFQKAGFGTRAQPGSAPLSSDALFQALEIEQAGRITFMPLSATSTAEDIKCFKECFDLFRFVYNNTYQLQSVEKAPDWDTQNSALKKQKARTQ